MSLPERARIRGRGYRAVDVAFPRGATLEMVQQVERWLGWFFGCQIGKR